MYIINESKFQNFVSTFQGLFYSRTAENILKIREKRIEILIALFIFIQSAEL